MAKSSVQKNLQKIHTYAQDIEAVRSASKTNTSSASDQGVDIKDSTKKIAGDFTQTPTIKTVPKKGEKKEGEEHTQLLVPKKPKLPAIRTMESDSKKIDQTKTTTPAVETKKTKLKSPTILETKKEKGAEKDDKIPVPIPKVSASTISPKPQKGVSQTIPKKITELATSAKQARASKQKRDTTYSATVITDTKHKRFSLWNELKKKLGTLIKSKTTKKKVTYTTPVTPMRKGVVQSATTNTARKTIADYSSLKNRVKARQTEENNIVGETTDNDAKQINSSEDNQAEIERTRFELLHSIEKEVGTVNNKLPDYLSPITNKQTDELPIFNSTQTKNDKPVSTEGSASWEHYTTEDKSKVDTKTQIQSPTSSTVPIVDTPSSKEKIHVPVPTSPDHEHAQQKEDGAEAPAFSPTPITPRILPTIPQTSTEIPDVDMSAINTPTPKPMANEEGTYIYDTTNKATEINNVDTYEEDPEQAFTTSEKPVYQTADAGIVYEEPAENYQQEERYAQEADAPTTPLQYFTQPKIEPVIPGSSDPQKINTQAQPVEAPISTTTEPSSAQAMSASRPTTMDETTTLTSTSQTNNPIPQLAPRKKMGIIRFIAKYTQIFILGGLAVASVIVIGIIATTSLISQFSEKPTTIVEHNYFNSSAVYPVVVSPLNPLTITEQITRHNNAIGVSEVILQSDGAVAVSPAVLIPLLKLPLDPSFSASLLDIRFGWYREEPFVVMRYSGDSVARGALLQWERTMYKDLLPLYGLTPISPSMLSVFKDAVVENKDVRILYTASGEEELIYSIVAPGHIIITTNEMSFLNLSSNFNPL